MSLEPQYPKDRTIENVADADGSEALKVAVADKADQKRRKQYITAGVAVGVGSAAIVAALLYSSRKPKRD